MMHASTTANATRARTSEPADHDRASPAAVLAGASGVAGVGSGASLPNASIPLGESSTARVSMRRSVWFRAGEGWGASRFTPRHVAMGVPPTSLRTRAFRCGNRGVAQASPRNVSRVMVLILRILTGVARDRIVP